MGMGTASITGGLPSECKGTVGSEAGDLLEPAVRRKSHRLTINWQEVQKEQDGNFPVR